MYDDYDGFKSRVDDLLRSLNTVAHSFERQAAETREVAES